MSVKQLDHLNLSVTDLEESERWYRRIFGFEVQERGMYRGRPWSIIKSGEAMLCLYEHPDFTFVDSAELHERKEHALSHFSLRIEDPEAFAALLEREQVPVSYGGAVDWPHSTSWYVNDPTGWEIEVSAWDADTIRFG